MEVRRYALEALRLNDANPRNIKENKFKQLVKSILTLPEMLKARELLVDESMTVLGGNMRLRALQHIASMTEQELRQTLTIYGSEEHIDYWLSWHDKPTADCKMMDGLTDEQKRQIIIKDNIGYGEWDWDALANEWDVEELNDWGLDLPIDWENGIDSENADLTAEEDDFDENEVTESVVKAGEIWQLGRHRLMCGDSTSESDVARLMDGKKADMVFTDPPYGNGESGKYGRGQLGVRTILNDENLDCFNSFIKIIPCTRIIYFLQWRTICESIETIKKKGLKLNTIAVWDKKNAGLNGGGGISEQWEAIVFAGDIKYKKFGGNVFSVAREQHKRSESMHPHIKPQELLKQIFDFIDNVCFVLDPFGGSGSTLIAAEQLDRTCYMMELDPHYCDVIIARWEKLTGQTATKIQ